MVEQFRMIAERRAKAAARQEGPDAGDSTVFDTLIERLDYQEAAVSSRIENRL